LWGLNREELAMVSTLSKVTAHEWDGIVGVLVIFVPFIHMLWDDLVLLLWKLQLRKQPNRD
jgi:hypothetical protein